MKAPWRRIEQAARARAVVDHESRSWEDDRSRNRRVDASSSRSVTIAGAAVHHDVRCSACSRTDRSRRLEVVQDSLSDRDNVHSKTLVSVLATAAFRVVSPSRCPTRELRIEVDYLSILLLATRSDRSTAADRAKKRERSHSRVASRLWAL